MSQPGHTMSTGFECYNCGREGHYARNCRSYAMSSGRGGFARGSYGNGGYGHGRFSRGGGFGCGDFYNGGSYGNVRGSWIGACYNCGRPGHRARDCRAISNDYMSETKSCYRCGGMDHLIRDCTVPMDNNRGYQNNVSESRRCYNCKEIGHLARDCPNDVTVGDSSQPERDAESNADGHGKGDQRRCYNCNKIGHLARNCHEWDDAFVTVS